MTNRLITRTERSRKSKAYRKIRARQEQKIERYRRALTPSPETKLVYIGEFEFNVLIPDAYGDDYTLPVSVPWTTIKEIMGAILLHAEGTDHD